MTLIVRRAEFSMEEPWTAPAGCHPLKLRKATDGSPPRLVTSVTVYADDRYLDVLFRAQDDEVVATYLRHDDPLYDEDVVEIFLAPHEPERYFEIEVNPLGATFDARIESPDGVRATMRADRSWDCEGLFAAIRRTPEVADTIVRIPFAALGVRRPAAGEEWRANFFRIDRSASRGDEFSSWMPTMKTPADFHVVAAFGRLVFE
jgi:hypothetical protein